jgi:hypothetical protein
LLTAMSNICKVSSVDQAALPDLPSFVSGDTRWIRLQVLLHVTLIICGFDL